MSNNVVLRTDERLDRLVDHLGYRSVSVPPSSGSIFTDKELIRASQERLRGVQVIPDARLEPRHVAHLKLARAIAARVFFTPTPVHVAIIPSASDRVRTAGMYGTATGEVFISQEMMERGRTMVDTLVHELAHHRQYRSTGQSEDLTPAHAEAMTSIAAQVVEAVDSGSFDNLLGEVAW